MSGLEHDIATLRVFTGGKGIWNLNAAADGSPEYDKYEKQIRELAATVRAK